MNNNEGWKSKEAADEYKEIDKVAIPDREKILNTIAQVVIDLNRDKINPYILQ